MFTSKTNSKTLFLGIDGGGSKCKAIIMNEHNNILGTGLSGPANPTHGFEQTTHAIIESAMFALKAANLADVSLSDLIAGVGLAGVNLPIYFQQMQAWQHPFKQLFLVHDLSIACLGAHHTRQGAVIITGTGSCGFACIDDQEILIGGYGFPQGDQGSGAWFGLQVTQQVLLSLDGMKAPSLMNDRLLKQLACHDATALAEKIAGQNATFYASLAPLLFNAAAQGDKTALVIVKEGANYINALAQTLLSKKSVRLSLLGGIASSLLPYLDVTVKVQLSEPLSAPEVGAILFARHALAKQDVKAENK